MTYAAYVYSGYAITVAALAGYAGWVISRSRKAHRSLSGVEATGEVHSTPQEPS
ncbi:MAG: heme exporter protein CcmD [Acidimicrobiia bacterium]